MAFRVREVISLQPLGRFTQGAACAYTILEPTSPLTPRLAAWERVNCRRKPYTLRIRDFDRLEPR